MDEEIVKRTQKIKTICGDEKAIMLNAQVPKKEGVKSVNVL